MEAPPLGRQDFPRFPSQVGTLSVIMHDFAIDIKNHTYLILFFGVCAKHLGLMGSIDWNIVLFRNVTILWMLRPVFSLHSHRQFCKRMYSTVLSRLLGKKWFRVHGGSGGRRDPHANQYRKRDVKTLMVLPSGVHSWLNPVGNHSQLSGRFIFIGEAGARLMRLGEIAKSLTKKGHETL